MNTKLAINLLTEAGNNLTVTLAALGLLSNGETIKSLQQKVDQSIKAAFEKQLQLSSKLDIAEGKLQVANEALSLAVSHNTTEQERLLSLKKQQGELQIAIKSLEDKKKILADNGNGDKGKIKQEIETIKGKINTTDAQIKELTQKITDGLALVARYDNLIIQANTAQNNANYHNQFVQRWDVVGYESGRSGKKKAIYGWVTNQEQVNLRDGYQNQANQFRAEANSIQGAVDTFNNNKSIFQQTKDSKNNELWLLYHELDAKNNLLSFVGTRSDNELALVNLQLDQGKEDLQQLEKTEIPSQEKAAQATNLKVTQAQSDLDKLKTDKVSAQKDLDNFVKDNKELLTTDVSLGLLKDAITKVQDKIVSLKGSLAKPNQSATTIKGLNEAIAVEQGKLGQLKQQYQLLGLEALEINQGRLESFNQQQVTETSVNAAVKLNTIEGYVVLLPQLVQQMTGLSDVWGENLKQNHGFTVEVSNLLQNNLTAFDGLTKYIGDNFADPYSDYSLNKVQLDEAIAIQDTQVKYRDALAQAVDDLGENIALQKKAVEQADALSGKLNHVRNLMKYEKDYATLGNQASLSLRSQLIDSLNTEIVNKTQDLVVQIDLTNDQQEQWIETNLQKYIEQKQNNILSTIKAKVSIDDVNNKIYGLETFNLAQLAYRGIFTVGDGGWSNQNTYPRYLADVNGDGKADIVGFAHHGVYVALANGNGTFGTAQLAYRGIFTVGDGGWSNQDTYPRYLADVNGDGKADIVGFAHHGVYTSISDVANKQQQEIESLTKTNQEKTISNLQNLRLETAYLTLQAEKDPDKLQKYLQQYQSLVTEANTSLENIRTQYYPELNQADTLANLQQQINKEIGDSEKQIADLQSEITRKNSESAAALSQATWYEEQAATHWQLSRKAGPTWTEQRSYTERTWYGKKKTKWITVTHVDHNWIIWDTYSKQAVSLREHSANLLKGVATDTTNQNTASEILKQWQAANAVADETSLTQAQLTTLLNQLDAQFKLNADKKQQIADWEKLLPTLQSQLDQAIKNAKTAQSNVSKEWTEYQTSQKTYQTALADVFPRRVELNIQGQQLLQEINAVQTWVNQQNTLLTEEITQVETLITQLKTQQNNIPTNLPENQSLTLKTLIDQSSNLLTQKQIVLSAQQATFLQKQTLLNTQKKVIETQYQLLDAYLESPDNDTSNLEKLLTDTQKTLAEVQKLAEQAEASSNALTALMDDVQASLLLQNDKYLSAIKDKQQTLQDLLKATELKENYTLQATEKQIQLNGLQTQLIDLLKKANDAGSKEAAKLLEVAKYNDFATVAELYQRDYRDLANDKGGSSSKGIARPQDLQLADYYYNEMLKYRQLKTEAEQQITEFTQIRTLAESQITAIQQQQGLAAEELAQLNKSIGNSQEQIDAKQEELAIAQFRIDALSQIRNWTEQTVTQLLLVEKLNFAQAKLEQDIAGNRQYLIDDTVKAQLDKQRLDIERDRQIAVTKLEQLNQIKTEEALQTAINNLRYDLGANPIEEIIKQADYKGELAGILADLDALQQRQPSLPQEIKTLLTATTQDIHTALQGKEAKTIQDNLLKTATALVDQANKLNTEVAKLDQEEQKYVALLKQSETNLQSATKSLYDEIKNGQVSDQEKALINAKNLEILYQIGYAKGAVDLSSELAKQSKTILEQILQGRIQERKARKKAFVNEIIGTVTLVISAASAVLTAGASLGINAALGLSAGTISSITATLNAINTSLSVLQAAYNGDWSTAIFRAGLSLAGSLGDIAGLSPQTVTALKTSINSAYVAYKGGDSIGVLLSAIQGVGAIAADGIDLSDLSKVSDAKTLLITASQISTVVHSGIQAIENGDVLKGIQALGQALGTISKNFSLGLEEVAKQQLEELTGLGWEKLNKIIDLGGNAYNAIKNEDWSDLVKAIGGTIKIIDEDFASEAEQQGRKALQDLTGLTWDDFETLTKASQSLRVAIKTKNIADISASLNQIANVWIDDKTLNQKLVSNLSLDWQDLTDIAQTIDTIIPAIRDGNTENWVNATDKLLNIWEKNASLQKQLKDKAKLEWTEFKQLVAIGQTVATAVDQSSINSWVDALKTTLDWALKENSFDNNKVKQIINLANQKNDTASWVKAVDELLGVAKDATALRNKLGGITGVKWEDFKQVINSGQAIATAIEDGKFTNWRDALKTTLNIWVDDATLQQKIETTTELKWEQLTRIGSTYEAIRKADKKGDTASWLQAADQTLTLWEKDATLKNKVKNLTGLDWQGLKDLVAVGKTINTAIDQKTYEAWRNALKQTINFWVSDQKLNKNLESLTGLNWEQLDKIGQASDALYHTYDKVKQIVDEAAASDSYKDWLKGVKDVYKLWKDDPILRKKVTDAGKIIWSEVEGIFKVEDTLAQQDKAATVEAAIQKTVDSVESTIQQKLESAIGLSWSQVKAIAKSGEIIFKAIESNTTDQWIKSSNAILDIWQKDTELRQILKDQYKIDWKNIEASVKSGQNIAQAIQDNTVQSWGSALQNILNIWGATVTLNSQQTTKLQQTNDLINQVKNNKDPQAWLTATNKVIDLWKNETTWQTYLEQNIKLSWQDISNSVQSGQIIALEPNGLKAWVNNLKGVVSIWKSDQEVKNALENVSEFNWQSLSNIVSYNGIVVSKITGDNKDNNLVGTAADEYLEGKDGNDILTGGVGNDTLNGGAGIDTLIGGLGNDTYQIDTTTDTITENANQGTDTVESSVTYTLGNNLENLTLTGTTAINGTGNALNNIITGNSSNNTLNGGAGIDTLIGGLGNDTYQVDTTTDTITENANQGTDTVQSSVTYTLGNNLENLTLTGTTAINGTGNTLNNILTGNSGNNTLNGGAGTDTLIGGTGNDTLTGGAGGDQFTFNNLNEGIDTITDFLSSQGDKITVSAAGFGGGLAAGVAITTAQFVLGTTA
ncbi:MAG: FG-GAP-like repeat-containing protein, partial [Microcystis sp. LE19-388.1G]|nr:FG-GAP-like repeat-containing protein [Microcystis sp. LE19-388.1G]